MPHPIFNFEWNADKAAANLRKHGVSFTEAATVFEDEHAYVQDDEFHSNDEMRQVIIGYSARNRLLIVSFISRALDFIRIITARAVTARERKVYEEKQRFS